MPSDTRHADLATLDAEAVRRLCGDITDATISAILAVGASIADLEAAIAWAAGESDVMGEARRPLAGASAAIYELLAADDEFDEES